MDEVAELLGHLSCNTQSECQQTHNTCLLGHTNLTVEVHTGQAELFEVAEDCQVRRNGPAQFVAV